MKTLKAAADALLQRNEITQEEYNSIEKTGAFAVPGMKDAFKAFVGWRPDPKFVAGAAKQADNFASSHAGYVMGEAGRIGSSVLNSAKTPVTALLTLGAGGVLAKEIIFDPMSQKNKINESYESMIKKTPQLAGEDQEKIRDYFDVIKTFSPKAASNPLVAGSLVNKMMQFGGVDHKLVQDMSSIEGDGSEGILTKLLHGAAKSLTGISERDGQ